MKLWDTTFLDMIYNSLKKDGIEVLIARKFYIQNVFLNHNVTRKIADEFLNFLKKNKHESGSLNLYTII